MKTPYDSDLISKELAVLEAYQDVHGQIKVTPELRRAVCTAFEVHNLVSSLGQEGITRINQIVPGINISSTVIGRTISQSVIERDTLGHDDIKCALTALRAYQVLLPLAKKTEEFRQIKELSDIL